MKFYYNFHKNKSRSWFLVVISALIILLSILLVITEGNKTDMLWGFLWIFPLLAGLGIPLEGFLGKKYISTNEQRLEIKLSILKNKWQASWDEVQRLELWPSVVIIEKAGQPPLKVNLKDIPGQQRHDLLMAIYQNATSANVPCNINGYLSRAI